MRLKSAVFAAAVLTFSGCATIQEPIRQCGLERWAEQSRRLKSINHGLDDEDPTVRLRSAKEFSDTVGLIGCAQEQMVQELRRMRLAEYAILDASIGMLLDKDESVRLASAGTIRELVLGLGLNMDRLSFQAMLTGLNDESGQVKEIISEVAVAVCVRQPDFCRKKAQDKLKSI